MPLKASPEDGAKAKSKLRSKRGIARGQSLDIPPGEDLIFCFVEVHPSCHGETFMPHEK